MSDEYNNSEKDNLNQDNLNQENLNQENTNGNTDTNDTDSTYSWVNPKISGSAGKSETANDDMAKYASEDVGGAASDNNQREYYHINKPKQPEHNEKSPDKKSKKAKKAEHMTSNGSRKPNTGKRWATNISMALVFGLVAGSVMYGVNYVGGRINGTDSQQTIQNTAVATEKSDGVTTTSSTTKQGTFTVAEVANSAMPSMVAISTETVENIQSFFGTYSQTVPASGSGVIVGKNDKELLIATNNHVVKGAQKVSVAFIDDNAVEAQIKGTDTDNDLAVVAVKLSDVPEETKSEIKVASLGNSDELQIGESVVAIGNALGYGQSVTNGIVSAKERTVQAQDDAGNPEESQGLIQTNAAINPGNSGGALLNMKGELIGINEAKYSDTSVEGMGFAIPLSKAEPILKDLMNMQTRDKVDENNASYLGITGTDVSADANQAYGVPVGVVVQDVEENGPADKAGIKSKDVIVGFDDRKITSMADLLSALEYYGKGEKVEVKIKRMGEGDYKEQKVTVTLGAKSDQKQTTQNPQTQQVNPFGR